MLTACTPHAYRMHTACTTHAQRMHAHTACTYTPHGGGDEGVARRGKAGGLAPPLAPHPTAPPLTPASPLPSHEMWSPGDPRGEIAPAIPAKALTQGVASCDTAPSTSCESHEMWSPGAPRVQIAPAIPCDEGRCGPVGLPQGVASCDITCLSTQLILSTQRPPAAPLAIPCTRAPLCPAGGLVSGEPPEWKPQARQNPLEATRLRTDGDACTCTAPDRSARHGFLFSPLCPAGDLVSGEPPEWKPQARQNPPEAARLRTDGDVCTCTAPDRYARHSPSLATPSPSSHAALAVTLSTQRPPAAPFALTIAHPLTTAACTHRMHAHTALDRCCHCVADGPD